MRDADLMDLTKEFDRFLDANPALADLEGDAVELLAFADLTDYQRQWLEAFVERWQAADSVDAPWWEERV